jgi:hypothetical protein
MPSNPLMPQKAMVSATPHPAQMHAQMWGNVRKMAPDEMGNKLEQSNYIAPILGNLAGNPKTTRKDVIKAAADAAGSGKIPAAQAVALISQMPEDPTKLQPWLKGLYAANLSALVHLKAATMPNSGQQQ